jgi:hypothetical protein
MLKQIWTGLVYLYTLYSCYVINVYEDLYLTSDGFVLGMQPLSQSLIYLFCSRYLIFW